MGNNVLSRENDWEFRDFFEKDKIFYKIKKSGGVDVGWTDDEFYVRRCVVDCVALGWIFIELAVFDNCSGFEEGYSFFT
jgi:hypothetical protein